MLDLKEIRARWGGRGCAWGQPGGGAGLQAAEWGRSFQGSPTRLPIHHPIAITHTTPEAHHTGHTLHHLGTRAGQWSRKGRRSIAPM